MLTKSKYVRHATWQLCLTHMLPDILINALPIMGPNAMPVTLAPPMRPNAAARLPSGVVSETYA